MLSPWFGEFMGTLVLIVLGGGVNAGVLLKKSKAEGSGWLVITAGWALAVMCGVFTAIACGSPDAHLNPAVTLGAAVKTGNFSRLLPFFAAQTLGAIVGASFVWLHYLPHWKETPDPVIKETTALGAAYVAGLAVGYYTDLEDLRQNWAVDQTWEPRMEEAQRDSLFRQWKKAVTRSLDWVE